MSVVLRMLGYMRRYACCNYNSQYLVAVILTACVFGGCSFKGSQPAGEREHSPGPRFGHSGLLDSGGYWRPQAVRIRVYPSTRFVNRNGLTILQARVELLDEMGDSIKSAGRFFFELFETGKERVAQKNLYSWEIPVLTLKQQRMYYEPIVRGYHFALQLHEEQPPKQNVVLRVLVRTPQGKRLETSSLLTVNLHGARKNSPKATPASVFPVKPEPSQERRAIR